jgi:hypothetical protein
MGYGHPIDPPPKKVPLEEPRPLGEVERHLLDFLLAGPRGRPELRAQAGSAEVVAGCSCGCPSVWLSVDPDAPTATIDASYYSLTAWGRNPAGEEVQVTAHVLDGRLDELELWAGREGPTQLPAVSALSRSTDS